MKKIPAISIAMLSFVLGGCSTIFTGNNQNKLRYVPKMMRFGTKLDHVAKFQVLGDAYRVKYDNLSAGEIITVHRKGKPIVVRVKESDCILPSEEHFDAGVHPAVLLDVLATSLLEHVNLTVRQGLPGDTISDCMSPQELRIRRSVAVGWKMKLKQ